MTAVTVFSLLVAEIDYTRRKAYQSCRLPTVDDLSHVEEQKF